MICLIVMINHLTVCWSCMCAYDVSCSDIVNGCIEHDGSSTPSHYNFELATQKGGVWQAIQETHIH